MNKRVIGILTQLAAGADLMKISEEVRIMTEAAPEERSEVSRLLSMILLGYAFADNETQEIVEIVGESHLNLEHNILIELVESAFIERQEKNRFYSPD